MSDVFTTEWAERLVERLRQNPVPRASGASKLAELVDEIVRLRAENNRLRDILAALREPSQTVTRVVRREWHLDTTPDDLVRFAVAAAEQEVGRE